MKPLLGLSDFDLQAHNEAQMFVNWCKTGQQKSVGMSETLNTSHSHPTTHSHTLTEWRRAALACSACYFMLSQNACIDVHNSGAPSFTDCLVLSVLQLASPPQVTRFCYGSYFCRSTNLSQTINYLCCTYITHLPLTQACLPFRQSALGISCHIYTLSRAQTFVDQIIKPLTVTFWKHSGGLGGDISLRGLLRATSEKSGAL